MANKAKKHPPIPSYLLPPAPPDPTNCLTPCAKQGCTDAINSRLIRECGPAQGFSEPTWAMKSDPDGEYKGKWIAVKVCPWCVRNLN